VTGDLWWGVVIAFGLGSTLGLTLRNILTSMFGDPKGRALSTVTASSIVGGFCGAIAGWGTSQESLPPNVQRLVLFALLGFVATVATDAAAARADLTAHDIVALRRRAAIHVAVGIASALIAVVIVRYLMGFTLE
jgi:drug/metabolite transporter (DMT)-like permease